MRDELEAPFLDEWLRDTEVTPPDPKKGARRVASQLPHTRQVGRWLPFPLFRREVQTPTATDTTEYQPSPIPATNGHTPTVIGRTTSMLSPVRAITAGAIVFAIGGAFLIAQPFGQQGGNVPGAASDTEVVPATWVTGDVASSPTCSGPTREYDAGVRRERDYLCEPQTWTSSDPRLTGEAAAQWNADVYDVDGDVPRPRISVITQAYHLRNEAGGWACRTNLLSQLSGVIMQHEVAETLMCVGDGEYDGLSAILVLDPSDTSSATFVGLIFPGDAPPLPEPSTTE